MVGFSFRKKLLIAENILYSPGIMLVGGIAVCFPSATNSSFSTVKKLRDLSLLSGGGGGYTKSVGPYFVIMYLLCKAVTRYRMRGAI